MKKEYKNIGYVWNNATEKFNLKKKMMEFKTMTKMFNTC